MYAHSVVQGQADSDLRDVLEDAVPGVLLGEGVDALIAAQRPNLQEPEFSLVAGPNATSSRDIISACHLGDRSYGQ
jgi:hypothetical protein